MKAHPVYVEHPEEYWPFRRTFLEEENAYLEKLIEVFLDVNDDEISFFHPIP